MKSAIQLASWIKGDASCVFLEYKDVGNEGNIKAILMNQIDSIDLRYHNGELVWVIKYYPEF